MSDRRPAPPQISPYVFPAILAGFGLWCAYDGWLTEAPEMLEHQLFNRIAASVLLLWAVLDVVRTRRREKAEAETASKNEPGPPAS